jgi:uncharacterized protein (TIGR03435 family)
MNQKFRRVVLIAAAAAIVLAVFIDGEARMKQRVAFEVASIRPNNLDQVPGARGGNGGSVMANGCAAIRPQIDPKRFAATGPTIFTLITWAYGVNITHPDGCMGLAQINRITGGPGWIKTDRWDIEATIPEGSPSYTQEQLRKGEYPALQKMILTLLEERLKLVVRREQKEVPAFELTAEPGAPRFTMPATQYFRSRYPGGVDDPAWKEEWERGRLGANLGEAGQIYVNKASMAEVSPLLSLHTGRPVVDRTGISGLVTFFLAFNPPNYNFSVPPIFKAIEEQVGFKLKDAQTTVEVWVIESVEKPSEN